MTGRLTLALVVASLIAASWSLQSLAQTAPPAAPRGAQGQTNPRALVDSPCLGAPKSPECTVFRLNGIDNRLNGIDQTLHDLEAALRDVQSRSGRSGLGSPISQPFDPGGKIDATGDYIQMRIDVLAKTVRELVDRVNAVTAK